MSISEQRIEIIKEIGALELRAEKGENVTTKIRHCGKRLEALGKQRKRVNVMDVSGIAQAERERKQDIADNTELRRKWRKVAVERGMPVVTYNKRVAGGMDYEKAALTPKLSRGGDEYTERATANGISRKNYLNRLNRGWSKERACTEPLKTTQSAKKRERVEV